MISAFGSFAKYIEIPTNIFKNGVKTKSKHLHTKFAIGGNTERIELMKPPNEINGKIIVLAMFAKSEYTLKVLK